jgi:hypothetical protein
MHHSGDPGASRDQPLDGGPHSWTRILLDANSRFMGPSKALLLLFFPSGPFPCANILGAQEFAFCLSPSQNSANTPADYRWEGGVTYPNVIGSIGYRML